MDTSRMTYGYYHLTIARQSGVCIMQTNSERAFVIAQLQDLLSPRFIIGEIPAYRQLASCVDLLAFSIERQSIQLVLFTIDATLARDFGHRLAARLTQYQLEYTPAHPRSQQREARITLTSLIGPHEALSHTLKLHAQHTDWEYDRYSSIGFYLHDRRGDWMRTWRLSRLYENSPAAYRALQKNALQKTRLALA